MEPVSRGSMSRKYCTECEWVVSSEGYTTAALAEQAIEHAVETGHDIDSEGPSSFSE
jgi:hypothetical protein